MLQRDSNEFPTMDIVDLLGVATASSPTLPELPVGPADPPPRRTAHRRRAVLLLVATVLVVGLWWGSGYVVAYARSRTLRGHPHRRCGGLLAHYFLAFEG